MCSGEKGELLLCKATGHSGFAKQGSDIVCSAVSMLLRTTALALEQRCSFDAELKVKVMCQKKGDIEIEVVQCGGDSLDYLIFLFDFLQLGFTSLVREYPGFVNLECFDYINK